MSKTIKFTVSDENYEVLLQRADALSIQDYIRSVLFPEQSNTITPDEAVKLALNKFKKGDGFTVPEIYGDEWNLPNGYAGVFGRKFFKLVSEQYSDKIRFTDTFNRKGHAIYEIL
jgi:hypothetical protein